MLEPPVRLPFFLVATTTVAVLVVGCGGRADVVSRTFVPDPESSQPFVLRHASGASLTILSFAPLAEDDQVTARIEKDPKGASDNPLPEGLTAIGEAYSFEVSGIASGEFRLELPYDEAVIPKGASEERMAAASRDEGPWMVSSASVGDEESILTILTGQLSAWQAVIIPDGCPTPPATDGLLTCVNVTKVDDGDTICVEWPGDPPSDPPEPDQAVEPDEEVCATERMTPDLLDWPVRLIGIDTPEADPPECYADEATDEVRRTLEGRTVWVELDPAESLDRIGRILAYVWDGSGMVNEKLVLQGFARERHWFPPEVLKREFGQVPTQKYADRLVAAADEARENLRGVWGECIEVAYQCHIAFDGWLNWFWDGEACGTTGEARQMEAIRIWLPADSFRIEYRAHVAVEGWQDWVRPEEIAGTEGRALQVEAFQARLVDAPPNVHVEYRAHVAELDWQEWMRDGATAGTVGKGLPIEAIEIRIVKQPSVQPIIIDPPPEPPPPPPPEPPPDEAPEPPTGGPGSSPNGRIVFTSDRDGNMEIYAMNADGSGQTRLTNNQALDKFPASSPDGSRIAFISDRDGNVEIYVMNADGSGQTRLTNTTGWEVAPAWSPDGSKIAFFWGFDIYVMNADGSGQTNLTNTPTSEANPAWSPDGSKIAFTSLRDGDVDIYVMNADGSGQTNLTNSPTEDGLFGFAWSPDGSKIAFTSNRDGNDQVYVMNTDGSGQTRLTNTTTREWDLAWSPDGSRIAFTSYRDGNHQIYVMNADGSGQTRLTNNATDDVHPSWSLAP